MMLEVPRRKAGLSASTLLVVLLATTLLVPGNAEASHGGSNDCQGTPLDLTETVPTAFGAWVIDNSTVFPDNGGGPDQEEVSGTFLDVNATGNNHGNISDGDFFSNETLSGGEGVSWAHGQSENRREIWDQSVNECQGLEWEEGDNDAAEVQNKSELVDFNLGGNQSFTFAEIVRYSDPGAQGVFQDVNWFTGPEGDVAILYRVDDSQGGSVNVKVKASGTNPECGTCFDPSEAAMVYVGYNADTDVLEFRSRDVEEGGSDTEAWVNRTMTASEWESQTEQEFFKATTDGNKRFGARILLGEKIPSTDAFHLLENPFTPTLSADFTVSCTGRTCDFTDTSTVTGALTERNWTFGDGSSNTGNNASSPTHVYGSFGTFDATLTVTNTTGSTSSTTQEVSVFLAPEFNVSAGLVSDSTLQAIGTTWDRSNPSVWGRDTRTPGSTTDGTLVKWNETLVHQSTSSLCPGNDRDESEHALGLAVSKDNPGRPVNECVDTSESPQRPVMVVRESDGDVTKQLDAGLDSGFPTDLAVRSLNNVSSLNRHGESASFRQLVDAVDGDQKWGIGFGDEFGRMAMDRDSDVGPTTCFTDGPPANGLSTGTECRDIDGFVLGSSDSVGAADVGVHDGTVWLLREGEETLERRTTGLALLNSTNLHPAHHQPFAVSKTGNLVGHVNLSGSGPESLVIRHASNGSVVVETEGFADEVNALAFHPRDERVYAANDTRLWAFNLTGGTEVVESDEATGEDTTVGDPDEEEDDLEEPFGIDMSAAANALGVSTSDAEVFYSLILVLGMSSGAGFAYTKVGGSGMLTTFMAMVGAMMGMLLATFLGWFPMWAVFLVFTALAAFLVFQHQTGSEGGG